MRIRCKASRRRAEGITLNLASMIDVTFLLLIYFMVTTVLAQREDRLTPSLLTRSQSAAGPAADFEPQIVDVIMMEGNPAFRLGREVLPDRRALVAALRGLHRPAGLFIRVADDAPAGAVAAAIQVARDEGFEQVTYVPNTPTK